MGLFGVLNVLNGIFVDAAMQASQSDRDTVIQAQLDEKDSMVNAVTNIFKQADTDGSGHITEEEFGELMLNDEVLAHLRAIGIDGNEAQGLFGLLDDDQSHSVSINEFITGCLRLKGGARAVDMVTLLFENKKQLRKLHKIEEQLQELNRIPALVTPLTKS